jgi:hypothetical protein
MPALHRPLIRPSARLQPHAGINPEIQFNHKTRNKCPGRDKRVKGGEWVLVLGMTQAVMEETSLETLSAY